MVESINLQLQQLSAQLVQVQNLLVNKNKQSTKVQTRLNEPERFDILEKSQSLPENIKKKENIQVENREASNTASFQKDTSNTSLDNYFLFPPVQGAKLGKDPDGNPGWFVINPDEEGKYLQII